MTSPVNLTTLKHLPGLMLSLPCWCQDQDSKMGSYKSWHSQYRCWLRLLDKPRWRYEAFTGSSSGGRVVTQHSYLYDCSSHIGPTLPVRTLWRNVSIVTKFQSLNNEWLCWCCTCFVACRDEIRELAFMSQISHQTNSVTRCLISYFGFLRVKASKAINIGKLITVFEYWF